MAKHILVALVEDKPGVLNRMASMFRRRGFNIESIAVGPSETPNMSRMTFVVNGAATMPPADRAEVKVTVNGYGAIYGVRLFVGYVPTKRTPAGGTLTITHGYDGKTFEKAIPVKSLENSPAKYKVPGGAKVNEYIRMEVK